MWRRALGDGFGQEPAQERAVHLHHVGQIEIKNVADRFLHYRMVAANVENGIAAEEIEVGVIIHVVEISAFSPGIDLVETNDALGRDQGAIDMSMMQLVIFAEPRCNDFFQVKRHSRTFSDLALKSKHGHWNQRSRLQFFPETTRWIEQSCQSGSDLNSNIASPAGAADQPQGFQSRYASCAPTCRFVFPGECRSSCMASHWNHSKVFCEPLRRRSSSM